MFDRKLTRAIGLGLLLVSGIQLGCNSNKFRQPILKFQAASAVVTAEARAALNEINRLQRTTLVRRLARNNKTITISQLEEVQPVTPEALQARLDALDGLNNYVDLLVAIANSDSANNIAKSATDLSGALAGLTARINGLTGGGADNFTNKFNLAGVVVAEVLRFLIQHKIKQALETAIIRGNAPINELIQAIGDDLQVLHDSKVTLFETERADLFKFYNLAIAQKKKRDDLITQLGRESEKENGDERLIAQLQKRIGQLPDNSAQVNTLKEQIVANEDTIEVVKAASPTASLTAMQKAHTKIVRYATEQTPASFADAVAAIEDFAAAARRLGDAVESLKHKTA